MKGYNDCHRMHEDISSNKPKKFSCLLQEIDEKIDDPDGDRVVSLSVANVAMKNAANDLNNQKREICEKNSSLLP